MHKLHARCYECCAVMVLTTAQHSLDNHHVDQVAGACMGAAITSRLSSSHTKVQYTYA